MKTQRATRRYAVQVAFPPQPETYSEELCACGRLGDANAIAVAYKRGQDKRGAYGSGVQVRVMDLSTNREILSAECVEALVSPTTAER